MKYIKKPIEVEAIRFNGNSNLKDIEEFMGREVVTELESETAYVAGMGAPVFSFLIPTKEGFMRVSKGDYVIKEPFDLERGFYPCKPDVFKLTYEPVI